jgi:hypothetical protein
MIARDSVAAQPYLEYRCCLRGQSSGLMGIHDRVIESRLWSETKLLISKRDIMRLCERRMEVELR